jgi:hypothetical protein
MRMALHHRQLFSIAELLDRPEVGSSHLAKCLST